MGMQISTCPVLKHLARMLRRFLCSQQSRQTGKNNVLHKSCPSLRKMYLGFLAQICKLAHPSPQKKNLKHFFFIFSSRWVVCVFVSSRYSSETFPACIFSGYIWIESNGSENCVHGYFRKYLQKSTCSPQIDLWEKAKGNDK